MKAIASSIKHGHKSQLKKEEYKVISTQVSRLMSTRYTQEKNENSQSQF